MAAETEPRQRATAELQKTLGHQYSDRRLLEQALTHRSAGSRNYERLEFLGDGLLNFVIGAALYRAARCRGRRSVTAAGVAGARIHTG